MAREGRARVESRRGGPRRVGPRRLHWSGADEADGGEAVGKADLEVGASAGDERREGDDEADPFTVAGTVFPTETSSAGDGLEGVRVVVTDADGERVSLSTNAAGNFFTSRPLRFPLREVVLEQGGRSRVKPLAALSGSCNGCHALPGAGGASGRLSAP